MNEYIFMAVVLVGATVLAAYARWDYRRAKQHASAKAKRSA
jgi:heme/copper-type cytochrome/quinol oxidase subunit 2